MFKSMGNIIYINYDHKHEDKKGNMFLYFDSERGASNILQYQKVVCNNYIFFFILMRTKLCFLLYQRIKNENYIIQPSFNNKTIGIRGKELNEEFLKNLKKELEFVIFILSISKMISIIIIIIIEHIGKESQNFMMKIRKKSLLK